MADASFWTAFGGGAATVAGAIGSWVKLHGSRESRFNQRYDQRFSALEAKVAECERREPVTLVISMAVKMMAPELRRLDPFNPVLRQVATVLSALPIEDASFDDLIHALNKIPGTKETRDVAVSA